MQYRLSEGAPYGLITSADTKINLGNPLVASLKLWSPRPLQSSTRRHAVEQTEDS
jgi:hypothetical protein